jgi:hypothetical protein
VTSTPAAGPQPAAPAGLRYPGLLGKLMAAVRSQFRVDVFTVEQQDPVFGGPQCRVEGCARTARVRGICLGHDHRWKQHHAQTSTNSSPPPRPCCAHRPVQSCSVVGCNYGRRGAGLCSRHHTQWLAAGKSEVRGWAGAQPDITPTGLAGCRVSCCQLWAQGTTQLCQTHGARWRRAGRPAMDEFVRACEDAVPGYERLAFGRLPAHVRLELQYAMQQRRDEARVRTPPRHVQRLITAVASSHVHSLLDWSDEQWLAYPPLTKPCAAQPRTWVLYARR